MTKRVNSNFIYDFIDEDIEKGLYKSDEIFTRFPPEPNGYLHIGHAKAICISFLAAEKYGGRCNLRFDDTNPIKEDEEYVAAIKEDVGWLGFSWDGLYFASEYFEKMYESAITLIKNNLAYVDDLSADEIRAMRGTLSSPGSNSPYRERSLADNLEIFTNMKAGKYADGTRVLRAKIDMSSPNINMRDPVLYRISHSVHHRTGGAWCIYPMYDFAHPIEDAIENITHSLCTMEFEDHRPLYEWVVNNLDFVSKPRQIEFARLSLSSTVMSKRKLLELVDTGIVESWDDPRMPTLAGLRRRGYTPESIRDFCVRIGVAKANSVVDIGLLEHCIRENLKLKVENRHVIYDPVLVKITNYPDGKMEEITIENNRENPDLGDRTLPFSNELYIDGEDFKDDPPKKYFRMFVGNEVRFKGAYFLTCNDVIKRKDGSIDHLLCTYDPATKSGSGFAERKVKGTIHWIDARTALPITVREYDYLYIEDEAGNQSSNPNSLIEKTCLAEPSIAHANLGERYQFFRHGYYVRDTKNNAQDQLVFNKIVGLKSSFAIKN